MIAYRTKFCRWRRTCTVLLKMMIIFASAFLNVSVFFCLYPWWQRWYWPIVAIDLRGYTWASYCCCGVTRCALRSLIIRCPSTCYASVTTWSVRSIAIFRNGTGTLSSGFLATQEDAARNKVVHHPINNYEEEWWAQLEQGLDLSVDWGSENSIIYTSYYHYYYFLFLGRSHSRRSCSFPAR